VAYTDGRSSLRICGRRCRTHTPASFFDRDLMWVNRPTNLRLCEWNHGIKSTRDLQEVFMSSLLAYLYSKVMRK
ncbi:cytochrome p450, partial [Moniliophthora roreri]